MPIKLPKGFSRRKSSGNILEDGEIHPHTSFRVFERPSSEKRLANEEGFQSQKAFDAPQSPLHDPDNIFAGSVKLPLQGRSGGRTDQHDYTGGVYESSSSAHFSSSSTCPSSAEVPSQDDSPSPHSRTVREITSTPRTRSLLGGGRPFSSSAMLSKILTPPPFLSQQSPTGSSKDRAVSTDTTHTSSPLKLLDTNLNFDNIEDDFQGAFDGIALNESLKKQRHKEPMELHQQLPLNSSVAPSNEETRQQPSPNENLRSKPKLLDAFSSDEPVEYPASPHSDLPLNKPRHVPTTSHRSLERPASKPRTSLRRSLIYVDKRDSSIVEDEDAKLVMQSLISKRETSAAMLPSSKEEEPDIDSHMPLFSTTAALDCSLQREPPTVSALTKSTEANEEERDLYHATHSLLIEKHEQNIEIAGSPANKVMTPSQFERYRQQQELCRSNSGTSKSDNSVDSEFDEDDEDEKNRETEKQRRRQEAHLSVYRQQMMKVVGQQPPGPSFRPVVEGASSTPNLGAHTLSQGSKPGSGKDSEMDDDDDVPLAILAAHGFPNKNRPPTRLKTSSSIPNIRASYQPRAQSPGHMPAERGGQTSRGSLPVFARNLPRDPYFGAGLVNSPNRESLAFGGGLSGQRNPSPPVLPPGGLIGVIASEERARAIRRSSPSAQARFEHQPGLPRMNSYSAPYPTITPSPQIVPGSQYGLSPMENTQIQLSQQMTQLMQTQMQWIQQMMHIQGAQAPQPQMIGGPPPVFGNSDMRPASMPSSPALNSGSMGPLSDQRTFSMLDPNISHWKGPQTPPLGPARSSQPESPFRQGYAPSIAPSERSNIGMAPRYRPVSTIQREQKSHTMLSLPRPWGDENRKSTLVSSQTQFQLSKVKPVPAVTVRAVSLGVGKLSTPESKTDDDADDEEGWAEMMRKRERKRDDWKTKRTMSSLGNLLNVVH